MKKYCYMLAAASVLAACAKEMETAVPVEYEEDLVDYVFSAGQDVSKTTFDGTDFLWTPGDRISIFDSAFKNRSFETQDSTSRGRFVGRAKESTSFYAVYPYSVSTEMKEDGILNAKFASRQTVAPGKINDGANLSVGRIKSTDAASVSGASFVMKNVGGYVKIILGESSRRISQINIIAGGGEGITGGVRIDYTGDEPVTTPRGASPVIGLISETGHFGAGTYYAVANPVALSSGLTVRLVREDDYCIELPIDAPAIVRNSARATTLSIDNPDALQWDEPQKDTIHVAFIDSTTSKNSYVQPFDEDLPAVGNPSSALQEGTYHLKGTGEEFFISTTHLQLNSSTGLRLEKKGYITFPSITGKRLSQVEILYGITSGTKVNFASITPDEDDAAAIKGGEEQALRAGTSEAKNKYVWNLTETTANTRYRIVCGNLGEGNMRISFLDLVYIGRNTASVAAATITDAQINGTDIEISGILTVAHPEAGFISWGVEYREDGSEDWISGPTGTGSEFSTTISGIDPSRVYNVRIYGKADAGDNVYSEERKVLHLEPVVIRFDRFGGINGTKEVACEYNGTASGGHWRYTGDRTGYTFPTAKASARVKEVDTYDYYLEATDTEPLVSGIVIYSGASNGYYIGPNLIMQYGSGYFTFPGMKDYRVSKVVCNLAKSAAGGVIVTTKSASTSGSKDKTGESSAYSVGNEKEDLTVNCIGSDVGDGVKVWISAAFKIYAIEITYAP